MDKFVRRNLFKSARWLEGTDDVEVFLMGCDVIVIGFFDNKDDLDVYYYVVVEFDFDFGETKSKIVIEDWKASFSIIKMWCDFDKEFVRYFGDVCDLDVIKFWIVIEMVLLIVKFENKK